MQSKWLEFKAMSGLGPLERFAYPVQDFKTAYLLGVCPRAQVGFVLHPTIVMAIFCYLQPVQYIALD